MSLNPKSPLLKKRAMDALLESMTTDSYDSLGAHRRGESTPEAKGTEFGESLNSQGFSGTSVVIPPKDLAPPSSPEDAGFFKESEPKTGTTLHRRQNNRAFTTRCTEIAKAHPDWDTAQIESQATLVSLGIKPIEDVLKEVQGEEKEARAAEPIEEDKAEHEFFKQAPVEKYTHEEVAYESPSRHEGQTCAGCTMFLPPSGCTGVVSPIKAADWCDEFKAKKHSIAAAGKTLYHVTFTNKVPRIKQKGILPLQTSNWVKGEEEDGERYGEGEIYAMDNTTDAVRWASKMDWEFNKGMGTGKISIIVFKPGNEEWEKDYADPMSQASNRGNWLKAIGSVKPEQIVSSHALTQEMVTTVVQNKPIKLADSPIISYGMGTPIGGTDNPAGGAEDEEALDEGEATLDMTGSVEDEYDPYDYDAEDARIAALMDEEDGVFEGQARMWASEVDGNDWDTAMEKIGSTDDSGWFAKSARPSDQKVELLQKQFKMVPEQIEECILTDPSPNQSDYVAWIAKHWMKGAFKLPEDRAKIHDQLEMFQKFKKSPQFTFPKDIQQYDPVKLFETLEAATSTGMGSKKEEKREKVRTGAAVVVKEGNVTIYKCTEGEALRELSGGTNWCTAIKDSRQHGLSEPYAEYYLKQGPSYVFFESGSAVAQLHPPSNQFMNRADVCMLESVSGESGRYGETEKFLADPGLAKALGMLADKEPDVKEWVKKNVSDPEAIGKILGEMAQEEVEQNTKFDQELAEYNKELAEYEEKMKKIQPKLEEFQKIYDDYRTVYDDWYSRRRNGEDVGERPQEPERPDEPRKPWNPAGDRDRGYGYRTRYGEPHQGKKFTQQIRHALAQGAPLSPEIEAQLIGAGVNTALLLKYAALFHPGQPWEPLAAMILDKVKAKGKVDKESIDYASKFIKGRWPEIEPYLLEKLFLQTRNMENMRTALDYAVRAVRGRWPEFEAKILKAKPGMASGYGAAEYAINVMKQPWSAIPGLKRKKNGRLNPEECMIAGNPGEARRYAEKFMQGKTWDDFQRSALEANNLAALTNYAADTLHARIPELEEKILSGQRDAQESKGRRRRQHHTDLALDYSVKVIKGRWPEYEAKMLDYAKNKAGSGSEYKPSHGEHRNYYGYGDSRLSNKVTNYVKQVIKGRWTELEQGLLARYQERPASWAQNQNMMDGYLFAISQICQERYKDDSAVPEPEGNAPPPMEEGQHSWNRPTRLDERKQKSFTKFQQDAQCYWAEGEQRLVTRDPGYEKVLVDELRRRASEEPGDKGYRKENKFVSTEDLAKMERPTGEIDYKVRDTKPDYTIWNGIWIGWYSMEEVEKYTDYFLANGVEWKEGVDIMELHEDLQDIRGRYTFSMGRPPRRKQEAGPPPSGNYVEDPSQPGVYRQSSLLKKKALIDMPESPSLLPPRDDLKGHMDKQEQSLLTKGVMQGVKEPLNPKKKKVRRPQIDPRINPDGVVASNKTAEYTPEDQERDEQAEYSLDQVSEAEDEAERFFMQEAYIKQLAEENHKTMSEMWDMMGDEYTAEFYGFPYKRVQDFTDEEVPKNLEKHEASSADESEVRIRFKGKEEVYPVDSIDIMKAVKHVENLSMANPGFPVVFILDEAGVVSEDTYINGNYVETVEKIAFRATR